MKPLTAEDLVVGGKYVPHSKSVGTNSLEDMKAKMKNEYLYYNGLVDNEYCFGLEPLPANDFWNYRLLPSDVTPYHELEQCCRRCDGINDFCIYEQLTHMEITSLHQPNQTTMNTDYTEQPFNLETALKHPEWVYFRNGEKPLEWHWFEKINSGWVIYAINQTGGTSLCRKDGTYNATLKIESPYDLILRVPYMEVWVNIYKDRTARYHLTKEKADFHAKENRIACVPVKIPAI
jgi:hypothetical protein